MIEIVRVLLKGEQLDYKGDVVSFHNGKLSFKPVRADIPIYVASNGPLGQLVPAALPTAQSWKAAAMSRRSRRSAPSWPRVQNARAAIRPR